MNDWRLRALEHLRAAQGWLKKAEQSFDEEKTIRGELNLMLAKAELKRVQEKRRASQNRIRWALYRHGGAFVCAILLAGIGMAFYTSTFHEDVVEPAGASQEMSVLPSRSAEVLRQVPTEEPSNLPPMAKEKQEIASVPIGETSSIVYNEIQETNSRISISQEEMHGLMQAAGRSLRGQ